MMIQFFLKQEKKMYVRLAFSQKNLIFCSVMNLQVACETIHLEALLSWPTFLLGPLT